MQNRDSSVWRSLAVAFGDGLAFGVGMTLSHKAGRRGAPPQTETVAVGERLGEIERRLLEAEKPPLRLDPRVLEAIVGAVEARLQERDAEWAGRLEAAQRESSEKLAALEKQHTERLENLRRDLVDDLRALEAQAVALQQDTAGAIPRTVEAQISARLERDLDGAVEIRLASLHAQLDEHESEMRRKDREIADLHRRLEAQDRRTLDLLSAIGQACFAAAEDIAPAPPAAGPGAEAEPEQPVEAPPAPETPDTSAAAPSAQAPKFGVEAARPWNLPLVSSVLAASGCLLCLHWL